MDGWGFWLGCPFLFLSLLLFLGLSCPHPSPIILVNDGKSHPQPQTAALALRDRLPVIGVELQLLLRDHVHAAFPAAVAAAVPHFLFGVVAHGV